VTVKGAPPDGKKKRRISRMRADKHHAAQFAESARIREISVICLLESF